MHILYTEVKFTTRHFLLPDLTTQFYNGEEKPHSLPFNRQHLNHANMNHEFSHQYELNFDYIDTSTTGQNHC